MQVYDVEEGMLVVFKNGAEVVFEPETTSNLYLNEDEVLYVQYLKQSKDYFKKGDVSYAPSIGARIPKLPKFGSVTEGMGRG